MSLDQTVLDTQIEQVTTARDYLAHRTHQNVRRNRAVRHGSRDARSSLTVYAFSRHNTVKSV